MNLRTRSYGSKALKNAKQPEKLPEYVGKISGSSEDKCSESVTDLIQKVKEETSFDFQIRYLRQLIKTLAEENHPSNYDKVC